MAQSRWRGCGGQVHSSEPLRGESELDVVGSLGQLRSSQTGVSREGSDVHWRTPHLGVFYEDSKSARAPHALPSCGFSCPAAPRLALPFTLSPSLRQCLPCGLVLPLRLAGAFEV